MSGTVSISKLKSELRQAQRLLSRQDKLNASLRVETERRVESLKSQIQEEQLKRGIEDSKTKLVDSVSTDGPVTTSAISSSNGDLDAGESGKMKLKKKNTKKEDKYKMLRHVEFQKTSRKLKQAERAAAAALSAVQAAPSDDSKASRKILKGLEADKTEAVQKLEQAKIDAWYCVTFPTQFKYVALYPAGNYVEFDTRAELPALSEDANEDTVLDVLVSKMPPARRSDEVRSYWRAAVKARLDRGHLVGAPTKTKKKDMATSVSKASKSQKAVASRNVEEESTSDTASETAEQEDDEDDFFE